MFYGHTHVREQHRTGRTLVANPGALFRANPKTCVVLDLISGELKPIIIPSGKPGESTVAMPGLPDERDSVGPLPGLPDALKAAVTPPPTSPATPPPPPADSPASG